MGSDPALAQAQAQATASRDSLAVLLPRLSPRAQEGARLYLTANDSTTRRTSLRSLTEEVPPSAGGADSVQRSESSILARDSLALLFYRVASGTDPWPAFRMTAISDLVRRSDLPLTVKRDYLAEFIQSDPDSAVVFKAIELVHWLARDTTAVASLRERLRAGQPGLARSWVGRAHQRARNYQQDVTLPLFMHEAPPPFTAVLPTTRLIRFFAIGDWADHNTKPQQAVSRAVRAAHARTPFQFGLTLGDNFYEDGLENPRSTRWHLEYEEQYGRMGIPIYAALGNHDFHGSDSPAAEIVYSYYSKTWNMPATHYTFAAGPVQVFIIDTENLTAWQLGWLDSALAASKTHWKIVAGHYDLYSNRSDGSSRAAQLLVPLLRRHRVAAYLNGHYHTLQHYQVDGVDYITSGAGGRIKLYDIDTTKSEPARRFAAKQHGFAVIDVTPSTFAMQFRDSAGAVLYRYERRE